MNPAMNRVRFSIVDAALSAHRFVRREWRYLAGTALVPMIAAGATLGVTEFWMKGLSASQSFLFSLPSNALTGWFMFLQARLLLLGERINALPPDPAALSVRRRDLQASVTIWLLFKLFVVAVFYAITLAASGQFGGESAAVPVVMLAVGALTWGLRFGVAHILAATGYSIRRFVFRVNGIEISLRLLALALLTCAPVMFLWAFLMRFVLPEPENLSPSDVLLLYAYGIPFSYLLISLLNAAACFALKDLLKERKSSA